MKYFLACFCVIISLDLFAQRSSNLSADDWVDSVFKSLTDEQKIAQLMIVRLSSFNPVTKDPIFYEKEVTEAVLKYHVGGICLFQGGPVSQANYVNYFQQISQTPLLICIDAENGLGMRMDSVAGLPRQMMLGAIQNPDLIYQYGHIVGEQCHRIGIQVNFAPVADINNNPENPVINDRSFGENKYRVAQYAVQYMKGLQEAGILACAKHFPGHGDVSVDSHVDLPVINKSRQQLDTLELYPFAQLFKAGVGSVMMGHLFIPSIDNTQNKASSLSYNAVTRLLRKQLKFKGLDFTDALEMKAITKYYPDGQAAVESLIAGNDLLSLPGDIPLSIEKIMDAIHHKKIKWKQINAHVKKLLYVKYQYGLASWQPVNTHGLIEDLNRDLNDMRRRVAQNAITLLRNEDPTIFPLRAAPKKRIAYLGLGLTVDNEFSRRMRADYQANVYYFDNSLDSLKALAVLELLKNRYDVVVVGLHNYSRFPANNFGISKTSIWLLQQVQRQYKTVSMVFGNPYVVKNFCDVSSLVACYEDDSITQSTAADLLIGKFTAMGKLPVSICPSFPYAAGIVPSNKPLVAVESSSLGFDVKKLLVMDSICKEAIVKQAFPGCVALVAREGKIVYDKAFGHLGYDRIEATYPETIYDLASVTKICATTMAVMKLYEQGKLDIQKTLADYLPLVRGTDKGNLKIWDVLLHQAGLKDFIPFYQETIEKTKDGAPLSTVYSIRPDSLHSIRVAENLFMRHDWLDTMNTRILESKLGPEGKYVYSDNDFIFMGRIVQAITGMSLDDYVQTNFYGPLGMLTTGFKPRNRFPVDRIAPTELELVFRKQQLRGDVHDPGAAMFGGVSGHAGLFSDAYDLAILEQMLLNGGTLNGQQFLKKETIDYFTAYHSDNTRRGLGFDKPEKDNATRKDPYPCLSASPQTFGHTGFTGTCVWVDPKYKLIFIFLSNRVNPTSENAKISSLSVRGGLMEAIYQAMGVNGPGN
jgi:beta-N-acetylhexosaminidase